jgi:hypothetical protein
MGIIGLMMLVTVNVLAGSVKTNIVTLAGTVYTNAPEGCSILNAKVTEVLPDGILIHGDCISDKERAWIRAKTAELRRRQQVMQTSSAGSMEAFEAGKGLSADFAALNERIEKAYTGTYFICGVTAELADDDEWTGRVYAAGLFRYTSVMGAQKSVRRYATSQELAMKLLQDDKK